MFVAADARQNKKLVQEPLEAAELLTQQSFFRSYAFGELATHVSPFTVVGLDFAGVPGGRYVGVSVLHSKANRHTPPAPTCLPSVTGPGRSGHFLPGPELPSHKREDGTDRHPRR